MYSKSELLALIPSYFATVPSHVKSVTLVQLRTHADQLAAKKTFEAEKAFVEQMNPEDPESDYMDGYVAYMEEQAAEGLSISE
jgi:hypothetical protein